MTDPQSNATKRLYVVSVEVESMSRIPGTPGRPETDEWDLVLDSMSCPSGPVTLRVCADVAECAMDGRLELHLMQSRPVKEPGSPSG